MKKILAKPDKLIIPLIILGLLTFLTFSLDKKTQTPDVIFTTMEGKTIKMAALVGTLDFSTLHSLLNELLGKSS